MVGILTSKKGEVLGVYDCQLGFWVIQSPLQQKKEINMKCLWNYGNLLSRKVLGVHLFVTMWDL